jgi:adenosine deaminase
MDPKHSKAVPVPGGTDPRTLPKALLHEHLDGGLRPQTLLDLCRDRGIEVPAADAAALAGWMHQNANSGSLERYLRGFAVTTEAMATPGACERVAFEAAEDAWEDGCVLAEFRMAPLLLEPFGMPPEAAIEAFLAGLARSRLRCGLIVCGMRPDDPATTLRAARLAARYHAQGVVGFDLAGAELGYRADVHREAFDLARDAGLGLTCHAGEAGGGEYVMEALDLGVTRIGHGINVMRGAPMQTEGWIERARERGIHFEVCPSSNVHTGAVPSMEAHPIGRMLAAGLSVSCNTDNRLMSGVKLSDELAAVHERTGLSRAQLGELMRNAVDASFLPHDAKRAAREQLTQAWGVAA